MTYAAFYGHQLVSAGALETVLGALKERFDRDSGAVVLVFEDATGRQVDFDLRGSLDEVIARAQPPKLGPGRPKLGVVAREISLLPRHWEWLEAQPSGASAALRKLVDEARKRDPGEQQIQASVQATGRFLSAVASGLPDYEEATRSLYARQWDRFSELTASWPPDVRVHAQHLLRSTG